MAGTCSTCGVDYTPKHNFLTHQQLHFEGKTAYCRPCDQFFKPTSLPLHLVSEYHLKKSSPITQGCSVLFFLIFLISSSCCTNSSESSLTSFAPSTSSNPKHWKSSPRNPNHWKSSPRDPHHWKSYPCSPPNPVFNRPCNWNCPEPNSKRGLIVRFSRFDFTYLPGKEKGHIQKHLTLSQSWLGSIMLVWHNSLMNKMPLFLTSLDNRGTHFFHPSNLFRFHPERLGPSPFINRVMVEEITPSPVFYSTKLKCGNVFYFTSLENAVSSLLLSISSSHMKFHYEESPVISHPCNSSNWKNLENYFKPALEKG